MSVVRGKRTQALRYVRSRAPKKRGPRVGERVLKMRSKSRGS